MPAPKFLSGLPKPVLFGLYGAIGGLLGALAFGELVMWALAPDKAEAPPPPPPPEPRLAVSASKDLQIYQGGTNKLLVQIARDAFDDDVTVRVEGLPAGVTASEVTIPKSKTEGEVELRATFAMAAGPGVSPRAKVVARAKPGGKAVTADAPFTLEPLVSPMPQADIVFVLDVTGSMQRQIDGLKDGIGTFAADLYRAKVDARFGCVAFRDLTEREPSEKLLFRGDPFTADSKVFSDEVAFLKAMGGGESLPESSLEAISDAAGYKFRKDAVKTLILITDAAPRADGQSVKATADSLAANKIDLLHLVINVPGRAEYRAVQRGVVGVTSDRGETDRGKEFNLIATAGDAKTFTNVLLPEMTKAIKAAVESKRPETEPKLAARPPVAELPRESVKGVQSSVEYDPGSKGQLVLAVGVWTGAIAALVCLLLLGGQHHYLRGSLPPAGGVLAALGGGLAVGLVGGAAGQGLFLLADTDNAVLEGVFRVLGWSILGGLAGVGLSLFIPNLKAVLGLAGGAIGGAAGAIGFIAVSYVLRKLDMPTNAADLLGRLAGGFVLGLCIGLMVAVVEAAFRRAWLEVRYGPREVVTVNLGAEPVKVGGDSRACTVWARGAPEVALRYFVRDGQVVCTDVPAREEFVVADGDERRAGNVTVVVRTGSSAAPPRAEPRRPAPPPAPRARPAPKPVAAPLSLDDEEDSLPVRRDEPPAPPVPVAAPVRPPVPATPPARPPVPAAGVPPAPKPASPPAAAPAIKPATRDPDACPSCGRKNAGRPGTRYCMVCDLTY